MKIAFVTGEDRVVWDLNTGTPVRFEHRTEEGWETVSFTFSYAGPRNECDAGRIMEPSAMARRRLPFSGPWSKSGR